VAAANPQIFGYRSHPNLPFVNRLAALTLPQLLRRRFLLARQKPILPESVVRARVWSGFNVIPSLPQFLNPR
jgi:hypothetical protein